MDGRPGPVWVVPVVLPLLPRSKVDDDEDNESGWMRWRAGAGEVNLVEVSEGRRPRRRVREPVVRQAARRATV